MDLSILEGADALQIHCKHMRCAFIVECKRIHFIEVHMANLWESHFRRFKILFLILWALTALIGGSILGYWLFSVQRQNLEASMRNHSARIDPLANESGKTEAARTPPPGHEHDSPAYVKVGMYVDRVPELSIKDSTWTADFYIWFLWTDEKLNPGETFQVVNGEIKSRDILESRDLNGSHYALYRVVAEITKAFDITRFPRDDHLLTISIEDTRLQSYQFQYLAYDTQSDISSRVSLPGYKIYRHAGAVKPHSYKTARGDPGLPKDYKATYAQFTYGIWIARPDWGLYLKMFLTLYAALFIALIGFFIKPSDRFGLAIGSFFAAVANSYITSSLIPDTGTATLADQINAIGMLVIALVIFQSIVSQVFHSREGWADYGKQLDMVSFACLLVITITLNIILPVAASLPT